MSFEHALEFTLKWEGGDVDDPADRGGRTRWGVSSAAYPNLDLDKLTLEGATAIYHTDYWDAVQGDALDAISPAISAVVFDFAVNSGPRRSIATLQRAAGARVDGVVGPKTLEAVRSSDIPQILEEMICDRTDYLVNLDQPRFTRGWIRRCVALALEAGRSEENYRDQ